MQKTELEVRPQQQLGRPDYGHNEVEIQALIAQRNRRDPVAVIRNIQNMATVSKEVAMSCCYSLPRGGKTIEGPSIGLAEAAAVCWGNIRISTEIVDIGDKYVAVKAVAWDLETNIRIEEQVRRRITNRDGVRFNDDMIGITANAAGSIAYRKAIFRCLGRAVIDPIYSECRRVALGDIRSLRDSWASAVGYWARYGITEDQVFAALGKQDVSQITKEDIGKLRGLVTAIKDGITTLEETFPQAEQPAAKPNQDTTTGFGFKGRQKQKQAQQAKPEPEAKPEPPDPPKPPRHDQLMGLSKPKLMAMCGAMGLDNTGNKSDLADRILAKEEGGASPSGSKVDQQPQEPPPPAEYDYGPPAWDQGDSEPPHDPETGEVEGAGF